MKYTLMGIELKKDRLQTKDKGGSKIELLNNINIINENIKSAAQKSGRNPDDITLIAVTKTVNIDTINEVIELGVRNIGENKVQEIEKKYEHISNNVKWHMIGHLQSNKVKSIIDKVDLIHSLDRMSLAEEIQKRAKYKDIIVDVLIEVNVAEEESKHGLKISEVIPFIESIIAFEHIRICGLMTVAPYVEEPEEIRYVFRKLKELFEEIKSRDYENTRMKYLSMGMTNDYQIAIEEGANLVRIGTGVFGERKY